MPNLTEQEKNVKIAEACGMTPPFRTEQEAWSDEGGGGVKDVTRDSRYQPVPAYLSDLNAMHEAEKGLSDTDSNDQRSTYCVELNKECCCIACGGTNRLCTYTIHATAAQRAEAFGKTLNLW
jgi:hypothetical protein